VSNSGDHGLHRLGHASALTIYQSQNPSKPATSGGGMLIWIGMQIEVVNTQKWRTEIFFCYDNLSFLPTGSFHVI
jgi:hypothetical protein